MTEPDTLSADSALPDHWSMDAVDLFETVVEERGEGLSGEDVAALVYACELTTTADRLEEVARRAHFEAVGPQGQKILHPAIPEARQARATASKILTGLPRAAAPAPAHGSLSERARRAARARWDRRSSA
jgi:hypothetical protein